MNGSGSYAHGPPIWLRTGGYDADDGGEVEGRYWGMYRAAGIDECEGVLDDGGLYGGGNGDGGDAWRRRILLRLPQLVNTDVVLDDPGNEGDYRRTNFDVEWVEQGGGGGGEEGGDNDDDDVRNSAFDVQVKLRNIIYLLDDEAIREGFIKVKWLGEYGDVVWENKLAPEEMGSGLLGGLASGLFLHELVDGEYFLD